MSATLIRGTEIRDEILKEIKAEVDRIKEEHGVVPGLVTILVGEDPASVSYVTAKIRTAQGLGYKEVQDNRSEDIAEEELLSLIDKYNRDESIHGILVQLPLPKHVDEKRVLNAVDPAGIQELIVRSGVETEGAEVVVVGRSNIVGKPIANMLLQKAPGANATVTVAHTRTRDLAYHCKRADILIVAAGVPGLVKPEWLKPGACVIDVGVNRVGEKISEKTGKKVAILKGDVDFDKAKEIAGYITPVPGGVGPMTITMLMRNTLNSLKFHLGIA